MSDESAGPAGAGAPIRTLVRYLTYAAVVAWWLWTWPPSQEPAQWNDSYFYVGPGAWSWLRPWPTVLFWKTFGATALAIYALHALSVLCWARLGWVCAGPVGVAVALSISGTDLVRSWNLTVLSEPLALSGLAWLAAETVRLREHDSWRQRLLWLAAAVLSTARVATAPLVLPAAVAAVAWRRPLLWMLPVAVVLGVTPIAQQHRHPFHENLQAANLAALRVGSVPDLLTWMQSYGMPWPFPERWANVMYADLGQMRKDFPQMVDYIEGPFYGVYQRYLLTHPEYTARAALCIGLAEPPQTLYPHHGVPQLDAWWKAVGRHVGYFVVVILALMVEPWAGIGALVMPVLTYHANVNEFERLNTVTWAWTWIVALLLLRAGLQWLRRAGEWVRAYRSVAGSAGSDGSDSVSPTSPGHR